MLAVQVLPAAKAVSSAGLPSGRSVDDLSCLVVAWVKHFNGRLHRLRRSQMAFDQLELAFAALGTKLTVTETEGRRHDAEFGTHSCH